MNKPKLDQVAFEKALDVVRDDFCHSINKISKQQKLPVQDGIAFMNASVFHLIVFAMETTSNATGQSLHELRENLIHHMRGIALVH